MTKRWLEDWPWETVVAVNAGLCKEKNALHKPSSEGYDLAKSLWEESRSVPLSLGQTLKVCRRCHKLSPFLFLQWEYFRRRRKNHCSGSCA
jgi:hypothetical protein